VGREEELGGNLNRGAMADKRGEREELRQSVSRRNEQQLF